jgi:undecaprenyl-diphosphatase
MPDEFEAPPSSLEHDLQDAQPDAEGATGGTAPGGSPALAEDPTEDDLDAQLALADTHSQPVSPLDAAAAAPQVALAEKPDTTPQPVAPVTSAPAKGPVAAATTQATQAAVNTAKQAGHQVAAAVQQGAQKITVAPRKAIYRGKRFMLIYGGLVGAAGLLAVLARRHRYFPADVGITRAIQRPNLRLYDALMHAVSNLGWRWISVGTRASIGTLMWAAGFRMESAFTISTWSGDMLTGLIKAGVLRPRPTRDLVRVVSHLEEASFPSGHVVHYVTFYGFLFYLVFIHLKQRWFRTALLTLLAGIILLVGPSRIYMGHHWPSDVGGAYLVGTLWLGVIIIAYLETKANYTMQGHPPFLQKRPKQLK